MTQFTTTHIDGSKLNLHSRAKGTFVESAKFRNRWQSYAELTLEIIAYKAPEWAYFDMLVIEDTPVFLHEWNEAQHIDNKGTKYILHFYGIEKMLFEASPFLDIDSAGAYISKDKPPIVGNLELFGNVLCNCINYRAFNTTTGQRYKQDTIKLGTCPAGTKHLLVSTTEYNAFAALLAVCSAFKTHYTITINPEGDTDYLLNFGVAPGVYAPLAYGRGKGLYRLDRKSISNENVKTILTVLGSSKNLPQGYGKQRLELDETLYPGSIIADNDKIQTFGAWNDVYIAEDIMPEYRGEILGVDTEDKYAFYCELDDFDPTGGTLNMLTGNLAGSNFRIAAFNAASGKITVEELVDSSGFAVPSVAPYLFATGDTFTIVDIPMPQAYIEIAQQALAEAGQARYLEVSQPRVAYNVALHSRFIESHGSRPRVGMYIPISDARYGVNKAVQCITLERNLLAQDEYEYTNCEVADNVVETLGAKIYKQSKEAQALLKHLGATHLTTPTSSLQGTARTAQAAAVAAAEAVAALEAEAARIAAEAYADGILSAEEAARIDDVAAKLAEAKQYAAEQAEAAGTAAKDYADTQLGNFATTVTGNLSDLQNQIDGNITTWFYAYVPTTANAPASGWTTTALKNQHLGDLFYDTETGYCYRYQLSGATYSWQRITDTDVTTALANAAAAQDTADSKRRVFVATPTTPYDIGDLWLYGGELYKCKVDTASGSFDWAHWEKGVKYTDDTAANAAAAAAAAAQSAADDAQDDADAANALLANIASDSKLTASEKQAAQKEWDIIQAEKTKNDTQADLYSVSKTVYTNAYNALNSYLSTLLSNLTTTSNITGSEFRGKFKDYYNARTDLLNAISNAAKAAAEATAAALDDAIQIGGRNRVALPVSKVGVAQRKSSAVSVSPDGKTFTISAFSSDTYFTLANFDDFIEGQTYTLSCRVTGIDAPVGDGWVFPFFAQYATVGAIHLANGRCSATFVCPSEYANQKILFLDDTDGRPINNTANIVITDIKLEKGNKATDWTPAPEDVQAEIDAADAAAAAAQTSANTANNLLSDIANDNKLTPSEKQQTKKEWDIIQAEKTKNDTQADLYSVSKTAYTNAYNALSTYLTSLLSDLESTSTITGSVFRGKFKDYYNARTDLLNAISNAAKAAAEATAAALDDAIQVGGRNLLINSSFQDVVTGSPFTVGGITYNTYARYFGGYNDGISNPTTSYHAHIDTDTFGFNVGEYNESNGSRDWKAFWHSVDTQLALKTGTFVFSADLYATGVGTKVYGGFYYKNTAGTANFHGKQYFLYPAETNRWVRLSDTCTILDDIDWAYPVYFYMYGYGFSTNSILYMRRPKLERGNKATDWTPAPEDVQAAIDANASALSDFEGAVTTSISGLQAQIDGVVDSWFYAYTPTTSNYPASEWTTTELKQRHIGDTFTNTQAYVDEATTPDAGKSWRWVENGGVYSWTPIADSDAVKALLAASTAQDTADGKRRVFTTTPTPPYDKDDLWSGGSSGDLKISTTSRAAGSSYVAGDWVLATKYTDDTAVTSLESALGELAYEDMVSAAKLDSTIIDGGYIKTSLIDANTIAAGTLIVGAINDSVDAIQVGGRNLLKNSDREVSAGGEFSQFADLAPVFEEHGLDEVYSLSLDLKSSDISNGDYIQVYMQNGSGTKYSFVNLYVSVTEEYQRFKFEGLTPILSNPNETRAMLAFYGVYGTGNCPRVRRVKLEKGNKATDWTPAPEDVDADATAKADAAKDALAVRLGYTNYAAMAAEAAATGKLIVGGLLNANIIDVQTLAALDGFIDYLTVKFLETVGDANGYKVQIKNSLNSGEEGAESYVRLVNSDGTRKAELVFDDNNVYSGASGGLPVLRITDNGCYSRVFAEGLEAVSTTSGRFEYNMLSQYTPFGMVFATGTHSSVALKGGFTWDKDNGKVLIYVNTLPRGIQGTVSAGFLYRSADGLNSDLIRYQS